MINLELLEGLTLLIGIAALWRLRPAAFVIAGNQLITLRALINIRDFGQPATEWQNPAALFTPERLAMASHLFAVSTLILLPLVLITPRKRPLKPTPLPAVPKWLLVIILLFTAGVVASSGTILTYSRTDPDRIVSVLGFSVVTSGLYSLLYSILLYELYRLVSIGRLRPAWAFAALVGLFTVTDYLQGQTGLATGYIACGAILLLGAAPGRPTTRRLAGIGVLIVAAAITSAAVRSIRQDLWRDGWEAIAQFSTSLWQKEPSRAETAEGLEVEGNGTAYAAQVLECISLYDSGRSRNWQSFLDPLINTLEPSFLLEPLGLTRPINAAVELQHIFVSGGGSYILGELYWNGGYPCVILGLLLLGLWAFLCDTRYRESGLWLMFTCQFAPSLLETVGYGVVQTFRIWFDGLLVVGGYLLLRWIRRPRASRPPTGMMRALVPARALAGDRSGGVSPPPSR